MRKFVLLFLCLLILFSASIVACGSISSEQLTHTHKDKAIDWVCDQCGFKILDIKDSNVYLIKDDMVSVEYYSEIVPKYDLSYKLVGVYLTNEVKQVAEKAFENCDDLTVLTIGSNVNAIEKEAFIGCDKLNSVYYLGNLEQWLNINFIGTDIGANPISIAKNFYIDNNLVKEIVIPTNITRLKENSFYNYKKLKKVTFHKDMMEINSITFAESGLNEAIFEDPEGWNYKNKPIKDVDFANSKQAASYIKEHNISKRVTEVKPHY